MANSLMQSLTDIFHVAGAPILAGTIIAAVVFGVRWWLVRKARRGR
jgi:uncharacterized membrane-anchored protein